MKKTDKEIREDALKSYLNVHLEILAKMIWHNTLYGEHFDIKNYYIKAPSDILNKYKRDKK